MSISETTGTEQTKNPRSSGAGHPGPPLAAPAIAFTVMFVASVLIGPISGAGTVPSPFGDTATVAGHFAGHPGATALSSWLMLLSSIALMVFAAVTYSRLAFLAPNAPGPAIAGFAGIVAAALLALSAGVTWVLSIPAVTGQPELVHALHYLTFFSGGPAHTAAHGVMVLGIAVTTIFVNRTPMAMSILGIALAAIAVLSTIALLTPAAAVLVPLGRFTSIIWIVAMSLLIPRERAARRPGGRALLRAR